MEIKELDKQLIERANSCSFNGNRGDIRENSYKEYVEEILKWKIGDAKKQKILDKLYEKNSEILKYEAQFVSVMVAGPSKYNAKKYDKSDKILELCHDFCIWFEELENQIKNSYMSEKEDETIELIKSIKRICELNLDPTTDIMKLAFINNQEFVKVYEQYQSMFKWRKNSNIYKLYQQSLNGEIKEINKEIFFEDENLIAYTEGERAYITLVMKPQRQLIVALKSRGWWWNYNKGAWSTYLSRLDKEWVSNISKRYEKYI